MTADADRQALRVATYNVHGCVGLDGRRSEVRVAEVIAALGVEVIGLQELDLNRRRSAGLDQAGLIAEHLGWARFFHPALRRAEEEYGDAILSRYPMTLRQGAVLPGAAPWYCRETRGAIWVEVATPLGLVHVFNTHFGLGRRERFLQAEMLVGADWLGRVPEGEAAIVLGDLNSLAGSGPHRLLAGVLRDARSFLDPAPPLRTYPTRRPLLAVDHIFVNAMLRVTAVEVVRSAEARMASDHFPLRAEIRLA